MKALFTGLAVTVAVLGLTACGSVALRPAGPSPSAAPRGGQQVTDSDENKTLSYHVGDSFGLVLHGQPGWTMWENVSSSDRTVLLPVVDTRAASVRGVTLAMFKASAPGTSQVSASASMQCSPGAACPALARVWKVTIQVVG